MMVLDSPPMSTAEEGSGSTQKGGRSLRKRETAACPLCFNTFYTGELEAHVSACLYFLEEASERKKHKKAKTSPTPPKNNNYNKNVNESPPHQQQQKLSTPNPKSNISPNTSGSNVEKSACSSSPSKDSKDKSPSAGADWKVPEAPVFRPSVEEFQHPLRYIASIRPQAEKYGICRIIPPYPCETWTQNVDEESFIFKTKVQNIHQLKTRWQGPNEVFVSALCAFLDKRGTPLRIIPQMDGRDLDLFKLFVSVVRLGGMQEVTRKNVWKDVATELKLSDSCFRSSNTLRQHYYKILYPYELYRRNKRQQQMEAEEIRKVNLGVAVAADVQAECLKPPAAPEVAHTVETENEFGFYEGRMFILSKFEKLAHAFQKKWFPDVRRPDPKAVEREFWRIVDTAEENVQVHYGSDLDVGVHSSGFPRTPPPSSTAIDPALSHWNLNHLPRMEGSVLRHITGNISGVTDPMIYVGMLFSSFCWHTEDNYLYSINYLHQGACKTWYGVAAGAAEQFEAVMKAAVPELFMQHPDLLHLLITMISPKVLLENKVPVVRTLQEPGQYVITFPQGYHAGFSHGFTCAEAVNFAPPDWLPFGSLSVDHYRLLQRGGVFSHEQLLCFIAQKDPSPETAQYLHTELQKVRDVEQRLRDNLRLAGLTIQMTGSTSSILDGEPNQCKICRYDCYLSSVLCPCSPQFVACLRHALQLCDCDMKKKVIQVRVPMNILDEVINMVERRKSQKHSTSTTPPTSRAPQYILPPTNPIINNKENSALSVNKSRSTAKVLSGNKKGFTDDGDVVMVDLTEDGNGGTSPLPVMNTERRLKKEGINTPEKLYQNHIPPAPVITAAPINYTPSALTKIIQSQLLPFHR